MTQLIWLMLSCLSVASQHTGACCDSRIWPNKSEPHILCSGGMTRSRGISKCQQCSSCLSPFLSCWLMVAPIRQRCVTAWLRHKNCPFFFFLFLCLFVRLRVRRLNTEQVCAASPAPKSSFSFIHCNSVSVIVCPRDRAFIACPFLIYWFLCLIIYLFVFSPLQHFWHDYP